MSRDLRRAGSLLLRRQRVSDGGRKLKINFFDYGNSVEVDASNFFLLPYNLAKVGVFGRKHQRASTNRLEKSDITYSLFYDSFAIWSRV